MPADYKLIVFYTVCAMTVTWMLVRLWRKKRTHQPSSWQTELPRSAEVLAAAPVRMHQPSSEVPSLSTLNGRHPNQVTLDVTAVEFDESDRNAYPSWKGRRLLETAGVVPRNTNPMPRVFSEDIP